VTLTFDLESGVRVTCEVGYLCANFSLPRPFCSRLRPDVRDRQTDTRRQTSYYYYYYYYYSNLYSAESPCESEALAAGNS